MLDALIAGRRVRGFRVFRCFPGAAFILFGSSPRAAHAAALSEKVERTLFSGELK